MVGLISNDDIKVLGGSGLIKNAVFYKDIFAFYDAYVNLLSLDADDIPNYCKLAKGRLCLEGICLFMKTYASELGFESAKLTLGYLKVIYYTIASYSESGEFPDRKLIEHEFKAYRDASEKMTADANNQIETANAKFKVSKADFDKHSKKYAESIVSARVLDGLFIVFLILGFMSAMVCFAFYFTNKLSLTISAISAVCLLVVLVGLSILFKVLSKRLERSSGDLAYILQNKKKVKDADQTELNKVKDNLNRILGERYEFKNSFARVLASYRKPLLFEKVAKIAKEYRLLSYNIKLDVISLFQSQEAETKAIINEIIHINKNEGHKLLSEIYEQIDAKDWLKFNNEVRIEFVKKFIEIASKNFEWKLDINGEKKDPFDIDAKKLAKEQIVYLKSKNDLFITSSLDKFLNTNLVKNEKILFLEGTATPETLRELKTQYISHFYDYASTKKYNNLFYDKKLAGNPKISDEIIEQSAKIPTLVWLKIKAIENRLMMGNASSSTIHQLENIISGYEGGKTVELETLSVVVAEKEEGSSIIDIYAEDLENFGVKYTYGENTFIGFRIA